VPAPDLTAPSGARGRRAYRATAVPGGGGPRERLRPRGAGRARGDPVGETGACIGIRGGRIAAVEPLSVQLDGDVLVELSADEVLLPGLVDTHVHVNEPGRTEWEGFATATRAAAAGGITTILDMPLNSLPPTLDVAALEVKQKAADGKCAVDVGFWGGAVPGNLSELRGLHDAGVFGFKCFLVHSASTSSRRCREQS
jgi:allantoinase